MEKTAISQNKQKSEIQKKLISNNLSRSTIYVPVDVYIIQYSDKALSSSRSEENIVDVFGNVNRTWAQANITLNISKIEFVIVNNTSAFFDLSKLLIYLLHLEKYNQSRINVYFVKTLHGSNGIALSGNVIMIADVTTVYDFRATSHEIGHVFGIKHVIPTNRLMARGVNGFELNDEEIKIARKNALQLFH